MRLNTGEIFAYYSESGKLLCPSCAAECLELGKISSTQLLTRLEVEVEGDDDFYFCDVHPNLKNDQII